MGVDIEQIYEAVMLQDALFIFYPSFSSAETTVRSLLNSSYHWWEIVDKIHSRIGSPFSYSCRDFPLESLEHGKELNLLSLIHGETKKNRGITNKPKRRPLLLEELGWAIFCLCSWDSQKRWKLEHHHLLNHIAYNLSATSNWGAPIIQLKSRWQ